jgi:hypothetical protein
MDFEIYEGMDPFGDAANGPRICYMDIATDNSDASTSTTSMPAASTTTPTQHSTVTDNDHSNGFNLDNDVDDEEEELVEEGYLPPHLYRVKHYIVRDGYMKLNLDHHHYVPAEWIAQQPPHIRSQFLFYDWVKTSDLPKPVNTNDTDSAIDPAEGMPDLIEDFDDDAEMPDLVEDFDDMPDLVEPNWTTGVVASGYAQVTSPTSVPTTYLL